jgi:hypothetical protein
MIPIGVLRSFLFSKLRDEMDLFTFSTIKDKPGAKTMNTKKRDKNNHFIGLG